MTQDKNQFYFQGKFFETFEQLESFMIEWNHLPLDEETADRNIDVLKKEIIMNIFLRDVKFTNLEFKKYINELFEFAVSKMSQTEIPKT